MSTATPHPSTTLSTCMYFLNEVSHCFSMASIYCTVQMATVIYSTKQYMLVQLKYLWIYSRYNAICRHIYGYIPCLSKRNTQTLTSRFSAWCWNKNTFSLFFCPCLLLVATWWHCRANVGLNSSRPLDFVAQTKWKKKIFAEFFFSVTDRCDHGWFCRRTTEKQHWKSKQEQELFQNLMQTGRSNVGQIVEETWRERERLRKNVREKVRKKPIKLNRCAFLLPGSTLGGAVVWRLGGWVVLCYY